jgi:hypothetical protein
MKLKDKPASKTKDTITIKVSAEVKRLIDQERKSTGETITKIIERAVANLSSPRQKTQTSQLRKIAKNLRQIAHKVDKIATIQSSDQFKTLNVVVVGKKHPWQNHPQKEKIYKVARAMHRVGANLSMIATGLNLEGLKNITVDGEWKETDVKNLIEEIKQESDYLPPIYSLPDES